jgi:hypothetical protein
MLHDTVPTIAAYNPMFKIFLIVKKWGEAREKKTVSTKRAPHTVISEEASLDDKYRSILFFTPIFSCLDSRFGLTLQYE